MTDQFNIIEVPPGEVRHLGGIEISHHGRHSCTVLINDTDGSIGLPAGTPRWRVRAIYRDHDDFVDLLQSGIPRSWESSEGSAESICVDYVREIERRLVARGGSLEQWEPTERDDVGPVGTAWPQAEPETRTDVA